MDTLDRSFALWNGRTVDSNTSAGLMDVNGTFEEWPDGTRAVGCFCGRSCFCSGWVHEAHWSIFAFSVDSLLHSKLDFDEKSDVSFLLMEEERWMAAWKRIA